MAEESIKLESINQDRFSDSDHKLFDVLSKVLKPKSRTPPAKAAKQISELFHAEKPAKADGSDSESDEAFLWNFWEVLIDVVQVIPREHPGQEQVLSVLAELSRLPPTTIEIWGADTRVWTDLPLLGACLRDNWIEPAFDDETAVEEAAQKWINLNSFAARLLNSGLGKWTNFGIWELREGLEEPSQAKPVVNCRVAVAAEWILRAGEGLFAQLSEKDLSDDDARITQGGTLYDGKAGLCRARWEFWKMRFAEVSKQVDKDVAERAISAAEKMAEIEQEKA